MGFLEGKSKLGFESWGAAFGKHLPRNPIFGISKLGDYGVVSIFRNFTKNCMFGILLAPKWWKKVEIEGA